MKEAKMPKIIVAILLVLALIFGGFYLFQRTSQKDQSLPQPAVSPTPKTESLPPIFNYLPTWVPSATWDVPKKMTENSSYDELTGTEVTGKVTGENPTISRNFENQKVMTDLGFIEDINLAADGPGASNWGYKQTTAGQTQVVIFGYSTNRLLGPDSKSPPFVNLSVFISDPFTAK